MHANDNNMNILVTGGAGFIGSHIVDGLIQSGHRVTVVDNLSTGKREYVHPKAVLYELDIGDPTLSAIFKKEKPKAVFHCAAQISVRDSLEHPEKDAATNILGSIHVLEQCKKFGVQRIVFTSTGGGMYGETPILPVSEEYPARPRSPYAVAKLATEYYLQYYYSIFGMSFVALRLANVYGPRQNADGEAGVVAIFCRQILNGEQLVINGDGSQTRDFIFVDDVVRASIAALRSTYVGILNIGTAHETSVNAIFHRVTELMGRNAKEVHGSEKQGELKRSSLAWDLAGKELGWKPVCELEQGLKETVDWFRSGQTNRT